MTSDVRVGAVPGAGVRPFEIGPHNCFACGSLNRHGLGLLLHVEPGRSWTVLTLSEQFEGWVGIAHGGILCTILDEVMAWALVGEENWGLTARLAVDFRRPVPIGEEIRAEGWVTRSRRRVVETAAQILDVRTGSQLATAKATYMAADADRRPLLEERYGFRYTGQDQPPDEVDAPHAPDAPRTRGATDREAGGRSETADARHEPAPVS